MSKIRVMIIDDDEESADELKDALASNAYEVTAVNDSSIASDAAKKVKPDIIFVDLKMPKKSGIHVAAEIRQAPELMNIPIIAMSAYYKEGVFPIMKVHGITKYLSKPLSPNEVIAVIEKTVEKNSTNCKKINKGGLK
jgi:CheY-like chemotaxis protein